MNRRQKIIVSITGIFLVLLILVGLTYAYFLTRINGNTNPKSISVETANLELTYGDDLGVIETTTGVVPGYTNTIEFTVQNSGDSTTYVVLFDNLVNGLIRKQDLVYTLTCSSSDGVECDGTEESIFPSVSNSVIASNEIANGATHTYTLTVEYKEAGIDQSVDMNKNFSARVNIADPRKSTIDSYGSDSLAYSIINKTVEGETGSTFSAIPLSEPGVDRAGLQLATSSDGGVLEKEQVNGTLEDNVNYKWTYGTGYTYDPTTATYTLTGVTQTTDIYTNSHSELVGKYLAGVSASKNVSNVETTNLSTIYLVTATTSTTFTMKPKTNYLTSSSGEIESTLSATEDDYGTSYYYRGDVQDNYVNFANKCWRIVRIDGQGNTKLILDDKNVKCNDSNYTGEWKIGTGNYGYDTTLTDNSGNVVYKNNFMNPGAESKPNAMITALENFQKNDLNGYLDDLASGNWCTSNKAYADKEGTIELTADEMTNYYKSDTMFYYDAYIRLYKSTNKTPTLRCNGDLVHKYSSGTDMYVGTITADEVVFAGNTAVSSQEVSYYLLNDWGRINRYSTFIITPFKTFPSNNNEYVFQFGPSYMGIILNNSTTAFRPMVKLNSEVQFTGDGTKTNPYEIK